ncbi:MAG TPA: hypothetical protein VFS41_08120, partial [Edaphobacter sp.]|nr:hypothetical protein [Edaphobacter sp.]
FASKRGGVFCHAAMVWWMEMILDFGRTRQERWAGAAGMALCLLVLVFSFAAKLSLYQPKGSGLPVKTLSSSKMWQHEAKVAAAMMSAPEDSGMATGLVASISSLLLFVVAAQYLLESRPMGEWMERETAYAVRRARFARILQFRAPPTR